MSNAVEMPKIPYMDVSALSSEEMGVELQREYDSVNEIVVARGVSPLPYLIASSESYFLVLCFLNLKLVLSYAAAGEAERASMSMELFFKHMGSFTQIMHTVSLTQEQLYVVTDIMDAYDEVGGTLDPRLVVMWARNIGGLMQSLSRFALAGTPPHQTLH